MLEENKEIIDNDEALDLEELDEDYLDADDEEEVEVTATGKKRGSSSFLVVLIVTLICITLIGLMLLAGIRFLQNGNGVTGIFGNSSDSGKSPIVTAQDELEMAKIYTQEDLDRQLEETYKNAKQAEQNRILNYLENSLGSGMSTIETLRPLYPDLILVGSGGRINFVPINYELAQNTYTMDNVEITESGEYIYKENNRVISHKGIDVSSYQGNIDWEAVAADGVEFAIIRLGYRGYGSAGKLVVDDRFENNVKGAITAGIKVGVYFFTQAITLEEVEEEVNLILENIAPYQITCPVVVDVERVSDSAGRMNQISLEDRTNLVLHFCECVEQAGYKPMIYYNTEMSIMMVDVATFEKYDKWYASYSDTIFYPYAFKVWQYTEKGKVAGISGNVDMNIAFEKIWE